MVIRRTTHRPEVTNAEYQCRIKQKRTGAVAPLWVAIVLGGILTGDEARPPGRRLDDDPSGIVTDWDRPNVWRYLGGGVGYDRHGRYERSEGHGCRGQRENCWMRRTRCGGGRRKR